MTGTHELAQLQMAQNFSLSLETPQDGDWIDQLHEEVFGPGRFSRAAFCVRETALVEPALCLVARSGDARVGTVRLSAIVVGSVAGYLLGPLAISPSFHNLGIGARLLTRVNELAGGIGAAQFILLVGDHAYYAPHGYQQVPRGNISFPAPVDPDRILLHLLGGALLGEICGAVKA